MGPSICEYECDKSCNIGQYLDYKNCKCRMELTDKLLIMWLWKSMQVLHNNA